MSEKMINASQQHRLGWCDWQWVCAYRNNGDKRRYWSKIDGGKKEKLGMVQAHLGARLESAMVARRRSLEWFRHILKQDWNRRW